MANMLTKDQYWENILKDLKELYGYGEHPEDKLTLESFKTMFDMGWDMRGFSDPNNLFQTEETFIEFPCLFEKVYSKGTLH